MAKEMIMNRKCDKFKFGNVSAASVAPSGRGSCSKRMHVLHKLNNRMNLQKTFGITTTKTITCHVNMRCS